jgi:hypothetical protein
MAWGTWAVLRPNSVFFGNSTYSITKRDYRAFIGFFFGLAFTIYLPTFWVLNLIFPKSWGSYSAEDGEWSSYSHTIAALAATLGSLGIMSRMSKIQMSPLKLEFYSSRFRPKEVADCLAALEQVRPLFSKVMPANSVMLDADLVLSRVKSAVTSSAWRKALIELIKNEGNAPRDVILSLVVQESKSLLETGQYHIWRGALKDSGFAIKATFDIAMDELVKNGIIDEADANKQRVEVANAIASVG